MTSRGNSNRGTLTKSLAILMGLAIAGCSQGNQGGESKVQVNPPIATGGNPQIEVDVGPYKTYGRQKLKDLTTSGAIFERGSAELKEYLKKLPARNLRAEKLADNGRSAPLLPDPERDKGSLILAFPAKLLGEQFLFGGVATRVSDKNDESLGMLKLLELAPLHVRPMVTGIDTDSPQLSLMGCVERCTERSRAENQLNIPVIGLDPVAGNLLVDLSALGQKLNLISIFDPEGQETKLKPRTSYTSLLDYSAATLVFDVQSDMVPVESDIKDPSAPVTQFTFRWYLKPASGFNPAFEQRDPVKEVGFFTTDRAAKPRIARWALTGTEQDTIHYFIKNVPEAYQEAFRAALDSWNRNATEALGRALFSYEFVDANDPKQQYVQAGDVRFNVIEWDLNNKAPYGGFGPSIANQYTGEIFSANTLIQGPTIIRLYSAWFKVSQEVRMLQANGEMAKAGAVLAEFQKEASRSNRIGKAKVMFGRHELKIGAILPPLRDPLMQRGDFDLTPEGETFESYMKGYFTEMVSHEVGHNLGLRHNFRGNLGDDGSRKEGSTSRSVMEYLGRNYRYINRISAYDVMAMKYGYAGVQPTQSSWYCTDEDVVTPMNIVFASPECSRDDATSDPFGFFDARLSQAVNYLINRGSTQAPTWSVGDMQREVGQAIMGLTYYGATGDRIQSWTNFAKEGRPTDPAQVRDYVLTVLKSHLCDPSFAEEIAKKETPDAQSKTAQNIATLQNAARQTLGFYGLYSPEELACN